MEKFWIALGDIHEDLSQLSKIENISQAEAILISGDTTNCGKAPKMEQMLQKISSYNPSILAQIGNMDTSSVHNLLTEKGINTHAQVTALTADIGLLGIGYSTPTPFNTPSEVSEQQLQDWMEKLSPAAKRFKFTVAMVHTPPLDTATDKLSNGQSVGSQAVRTWLEELQPDICITGHIHESKAEDKIGKTKIINPGNFGAGGYVLLKLTEQGIDAKLMQV